MNTVMLMLQFSCWLLLTRLSGLKEVKMRPVTSIWLLDHGLTM
jgi:hypothetical protein